MSNNRMDYDADQLEVLLLAAFKRLEANQLIDMNDPIYEWYLAYNSDIAEITEKEAIAALDSLPPKHRANLIEYVEATGKLPLKQKAAPPALVGSKPIVKATLPVRKQHRKHSY